MIGGKIIRGKIIFAEPFPPPAGGQNHPGQNHNFAPNDFAKAARALTFGLSVLLLALAAIGLACWIEACSR